MKRLLGLVMAWGFVALLLSSAWAQAEGRVVVVQGAEVGDLDISLRGGVLNLNPGLHLMDPLVSRDADLNLVPWLAVSWEWPDDTTLVMQLREGVRFHDGSPFSADDVVFTFDRIVAEGDVSNHARYFNDTVVGSIEATGPLTVVFHLVEPYAPFVTHLTTVGIASRAAVERLGEDAYRLAPVGTGAYVLSDWRPGIHIRMSANQDWWGGAPSIAEIEFRTVGEGSTRTAEVLTGRADIVTGLPPSDIPRVEASGAATVAMVPSLRSIWMGFNTRKPPLNDVRVREAVNLAVDMDGILEFILEGMGQRIYNVIGPNVFGYQDDMEPIAYDPERARQLLAEAGYPNGFTLNLLTREGRLLRDVEIAQAIIAQLSVLGINVDMQLVDQERQLAINATYTDDVDLWLASNANLTADAHYNLGLNFYGGTRAVYWDDPRLDALIDAGVSTADPDARMAIYREALALIRSEWPVFFMHNQQDIYGVSERLAAAGWTPRSDEIVSLIGLSLD